MVLKFNPFGLHVVAFMKLPINTENPHWNTPSFISKGIIHLLGHQLQQSYI
jgi:hypothetical protein